MRSIDETYEPVASSSSSSSSYFNGAVENLPCSSNTHESKTYVHESYKSIQQPWILCSKNAGQTASTFNRRCDFVGNKSDDCPKNIGNLSGKMTLWKAGFTRKMVESTRKEWLSNYNFHHGWFSPTHLLLLLLFWSSPTTLAAPSEATSANSTLAEDILAVERLKDLIIPSATSEKPSSSNLTASQPHPSSTSTIPTAADVIAAVNTDSINLAANSSAKTVNDTSSGLKSSADGSEMKREIANAHPSSASTNSESDDSNFNDDCSDQHYKVWWKFV